MNEQEARLENNLYECIQHKKMIKFAIERAIKILPLSVEAYSCFKPEDIGAIDQFLFRFSRLQDSMGEKLFSNVLLLLGEDYSKKPFIDVLNRLEKLDLLDKEEWLTLRKIRNSVAHEYSFNKEELVDSLNGIYNASAKLLAIFDTFYLFCFEKFDFIRESNVLSQ